MVKISVIVCTHNPREDYFKRVLEALKTQTLSKDVWELLVIDNCSSIKVQDTWNIAWHPNARHIEESEAGLTPARLCGIRESQGSILVFVDDDCLLKADYLENTLDIAKQYPHIGAWGAEIEGEPEAVIPPEMQPFQWYLTIAPLERDEWSNLYQESAPRPFGAGLCLRSNAAEHYVRMTENSAPRKLLDRNGSSLAGCGDFDLAYTALDMGYGIGRFKSLFLTHLIPKDRLRWDYLEKAVIGGNSSFILLRHLRGLDYKKSENLRDKLKYAMDYLKCDKGNRRLMKAQREAWKTGLKLVSDHILNTAK